MKSVLKVLLPRGSVGNHVSGMAVPDGPSIHATVRIPFYRRHRRSGCPAESNSKTCSQNRNAPCADFAPVPERHSMGTKPQNQQADQQCTLNRKHRPAEIKDDEG